ncbi:heme NO-binding domain-containing protein [Agarilytica rhodophyticola]|uniref:heme NO-binding domain-containing protein n=1 Tax=Agarilytica rhodophyticola TaxID=1737490 RepID=UPI000B346518|nr:heme NO-binding domain-containing protein [Agarilytica rhodophyticola]
MKGVVFIAINDMVEDKFGIETWESILNEVNPKNGGIYTSTEDYPDEEVVSFVIAISKALSVDTTEVTRSFGTFLFGELNRKYDIFTKLTDNLFDFLCSIENVIHKEVRKLYENPSLPSLDCQKINDSELLVKYSSPRKLCYLAEGLILGASEFYNEDITLKHESCVHSGDDVCRLRVTKNA